MTKASRRMNPKRRGKWPKKARYLQSRQGNPPKARRTVRLPLPDRPQLSESDERARREEAEATEEFRRQGLIS